MTIPWPEFESAIDQTILDRGRQYWRRGRVQELAQDEDNHWSALVEGSEVYETTITLAGASAICECDCPYDLGPTCKHSAAVLYAVREALTPGATEQSEPKSKERSGRGQAKRSASVRSVLEALTTEELVDAVTRYAKKDAVFRTFILSHAPASDATDKNHYRRLIHLSLQAGMNRDGFIDYRGGARAVKGVDELIDQALHCLATDIAKTIAICQAALEELIPALQYADDSNGEIGGSIDNAVELLADVPTYLKDPTARQELFDYCLAESTHDRQQGWDWRWNLLSTAGDLTDTDKAQARLFSHLDRIMADRSKDNVLRRYDEERIAEIKVTIIRRRQGGTRAREFISRNLEHPSLRRQALTEAADTGDTTIIKRLAQAGLEADQAYLGLVIEWLDWLLRAAELEHNIDDIRRYTRELLFASGDLKYFDILKRNHDAANWPPQLSQLLKDIQDSQSRANSLDTLIGIYRREQDWQGIYRLVRRRSSLILLKIYHDDLIKYGSDPLFALYHQTIHAELKTATSRGHYQEVCRALRRLRKSGSAVQVAAFVDELKSRYPKRPALLEELENI